MKPRGLLGYELERDAKLDGVTAHGGLPVVAEAYRAFGVGRSVGQHLHVKQRRRGFDEATLVESFLELLAAGGECLDDFAVLAQDHGLVRLLEHPWPSPEAARRFLYAFHDEHVVAHPPDQLAWIPPETPPLEGLAAVNRDLVATFARHAAAGETATLELDATLIESHKREALPHYEGGRGYQPQVVVWSEARVIVADQFRDGNVAAEMQALPLVRQGFAALPDSVRQRFFRADAACYQHGVLDWLRDEARADGPPGPIGFAISADMSRELRRAIERLPSNAWRYFPREPADEYRQWAEVEFVPSDGTTRKGAAPDRYLAIRILPRQGDLFADGEAVKHFAVVTNLDWDGARILDWQRQKAGSVEAVHDALKNDLGAGVLPCGRFGANAAWFRLNVLTHNLLQALQQIALPPTLRDARLKRLRFALFDLPGRIVQHARRTLLRLGASAAWFPALTDARLRLATLPA